MRFAELAESFAVGRDDDVQCCCPSCMGQDIFDAFAPPTSGVDANGKTIFSWDQAASQLTRSNNTWSSQLGQGVTISYAFRSTAPATMPEDTQGFQRFTATQITVAEEALRLWSDVANITFLRVGTGTTGEEAYANNASILFSNYTSGVEGASAFAFLPSPGSTNASSVAGDVWINFSISANANPVFGDFGPHTIAHEIGHAIGLRHPGDYDGGEPTYAADAEYWQDARMFTIMSYFGSTNTGGSLPLFSVGPQLHDIAAAQRLYGANMTTRTGDTVYGFNATSGHQHSTIASASTSVVFAIWDAGGVDTLDLSGYATNSEIDLRQEAFSSAGPNPTTGGVSIGNIAIARGAVIENAIGGAGADMIFGNGVANILRGGAGADTLSGFAGADTLEGGGDNDTLNGGVGNDMLNGGDGVDTATFSATRSSTMLVSFNGTTAALNMTGRESDRLVAVETLQFTDQSVSASVAIAFRPLDYIASHNDLIGALGANAALGFEHYIANGYFEGRAQDQFDGFQYLASYTDLIRALGANDALAAQHFIASGFMEGRSRDLFDGIQYVASYNDLISMIGASESLAAQHFVTSGFGAGRAADIFDGIRYIAGYNDLIAVFGPNDALAAQHFVASGFNEGRSRTAFDPFQYIASHSDLIGVFGANATLGSLHFVANGFAEGRARDTFDAAQYLANYADLQAVFGNDLFTATLHYIQNGFAEGRTDDPFG